jgi:acetyl-CoA acetyltransferase
MTGIAAFTGVGFTPFTRRSDRSVQDLALESATAALADADLLAEQVDLFIPVGGALFAEDMIAGLGLSRTLRDALPAPGGNAAVNAVALAAALLASDYGRVALITFARNGSSRERISSRVAALPGRQFRESLERPQGWSVPAEWYAMICRRHMNAYGTTARHLAAVAIAARENAQLNPRAMLCGRPLALDAYLASPLIAEPYRLYDCCLETDGAVSVILTREPRQHRDVRLIAAQSARPESPDDLTNRADWFDIGLTVAAPRAFEEAGLGPSDIDAAMIYDCFTFEVIHQLEEAGFCPRGEGGPFVSSGAIQLAGTLPVNPHGGLLAEGHLGGLAHVAEAVVQLRGEAGARQVPDARAVAVTGWGDWGDGSLAILQAG